MTITAERNEVFIDVSSTVAAEHQVMNFQIPHAATDLAAPTVTYQNAKSHLLRKLGISLQLQALALHGPFAPF